MILHDAVTLSLDNLRQSRLRTVLTALGVAIGVGSIVGMLAIAVGLQDNLYAKLFRNVFFRRITVFAAFGQDQQNAKPLDDAAVAAIRQIPGVRNTTRETRIPGHLEIAGKQSHPLGLAGVTLDDADEGVFADLKAGRFFQSDDANEIIVNNQTAESLGFKDARQLVGQTVRAVVQFPFQRRMAMAPMAGFTPPEIPTPPPLDLKVVGIVQRDRAIFIDPSNRVAYVPQKVAERQVEFFQKSAPLLAGMALGAAPLQVRLNDARDVDRVEKEIRALGFRTISISSIVSNLRRVFVVVDMLLALIGSMALAVASLGIINTMVMAVLERTREIGVMKAVGAEDGDIRRIFVTESGIIGLAGGLAGLLMAWLLGRAVNWGVNIYLVRQGLKPEVLFHIPLWLVASSLSFALLVAIASGLYPAARAARIDPTRALRHD